LFFTYFTFHRNETILICCSFFFFRLFNSNYDLRTAYSRGLISSSTHQILDRARNQSLTLADALKMGILKVGEPQSYNMISKTESLVISSVLDQSTNTYIDPNTAIRKKILDPYHGSYLNNLTQETISIDDAMNRNFILVHPQSTNPPRNQQNDKYVISTSLIRETRSFHLLGVRDYRSNRELSVQEAIRLGILDKKNGQYINQRTGQVLSISEAISQGHIRAQALPVDSSADTNTNANANQDTSSTTKVKRGTVKETKTYTLKSAIHPRTQQEISIRQAVEEGIIDHGRGFYVNTVTGETLPISVAIERGLIFTELVDQHARRTTRTLIIEHVVDAVTRQRLGVTEAIRTGLLNSTITAYNHPVDQRQITIADAFQQGLILGQLVDQNPSTFITDQRQQNFYLITHITDLRTNRVFTLQEGIQQRLFDRQRGVYINPLTNAEISINEGIKRGIIQVQAVSAQISDQTSSRSAVSVHVQPSQPQGPARMKATSSDGRTLVREQEIIEVESGPRTSRNRRHHRKYSDEEIIEERTTNVVDKEIYIRGRSNERPKPQKPVHSGSDRNQQDFLDFHQEHIVIHETLPGEFERPKPVPLPKPKITRDESGSFSRTHIEQTQTTQQPQRPDHSQDDQQHQSWTEEEWEQWNATLMIKDKPYRIVWVMNTATGDRLPLQNAHQHGLVDTKQRLFFDEKLNRQPYSFERAVELGYMGIEPDTASFPIRVDGIDYMIHWVLDSSTKRRIFPRQAIAKGFLNRQNGRYMNPYNQAGVSLHEAVHLKFVGATEYGSTSDSITITVNGQPYTIKWVYDLSHMKKFLPRDALRLGLIDLQLNEYRNLGTNDIMTIYEAIQAGHIRCTDDDSESDSSVRLPSNISVDEDELTIATKTATYVITAVIHPSTQKEIKVSEAIDLGILDKDTGKHESQMNSLLFQSRLFFLIPKILVRKLNLEISRFLYIYSCFHSVLCIAHMKVVVFFLFIRVYIYGDCKSTHCIEKVTDL